MRKLTSQMTSVELAKTFAAHYGWTGHHGGWISDAHDNVICQGWTALATALQGRGWIRVGAGIDWRAAGQTPRLNRAGKMAY